MQFKIKKSTRMKKVFNAFSDRKGIQYGSMRFMLDGERVDAEKTAGELELEEGDQMDCFLEQTGGCRL